MRRPLLLAGLLTVLAPLPALAAPAPAPVVTDVAGDANGVNDQGEGLLGDRTEVESSPEADLRTVRLSAAGRRALALTVTTTAPLAEHARTGRDVALTVVAHVTSDCLFSVSLTSADAGTALLGASGCGDGRAHQLPVTQRGSELRVVLPYALLPARPGAELRNLRAATRLVPHEGLNVVELDGADGAYGARLPR